MNKRSRYLMMGFSAMFLIMTLNSYFACAYIPYDVNVDEIIVTYGTLEDDYEIYYLEPFYYSDDIDIDSVYWEFGYRRVEYYLVFENTIDKDDLYSLHISHQLNSISRDLTVYYVTDLNDDGEFNGLENDELISDGLHYCGDYGSGSHTYYGDTIHDVVGLYCYDYKFLLNFNIEIETCYVSCRAY